MKPETMNLKNGTLAVLTLAIALMFTVQPANSLGVTRPVPYDIELMRGESAGFVFEIQAVTSMESQSCTFGIGGLEGLDLEFEEEEVTVDAGSIANVYGTVSAPSSAEIKMYSGTLTVSCGSAEAEEVGGSVVKTTVGGSQFNVNVVEFRESDIRNVSPPPEQAPDYTIIIILFAIILIIVVAGVYYYFENKKGK